MDITMMENTSAPFSTYFIVEYDEHNSAETWTSGPMDEGWMPGRSRDINEVLWPSIFNALIIIANIVSLWAFCVEKRLRTYNNYFIINLTMLDLLTGVILIPTVMHTHIGYYPFSQDVCKIVKGLRDGILNASNLVVIIISVDRYRATYDPINHYMSRSKRLAFLANALAWVVSLTFWLTYSTAVDFITDFDSGLHCVSWYDRNPFTSIISSIALFYVPFVIIAVLNYRIFSKIQQTLGGKGVEKEFDLKDKKTVVEILKPEMSSAVSDVTVNVDLEASKTDMKSKKHDNKNVQKTEAKRVARESPVEMRKATYALLLIVIAFVVSWLPQSIILLTYSIKPLLVIQGLPRSGQLFFGLMTYFNSLLNPISYAVSQPLFRNTIANLVLCRRNRK